MFLAGFVATAIISLASFFAILAFASPQASSTVIGLFFLTFFASITSIAVLGHFVIFRLKGISPYGQPRYWGVIFRRGIFLGGFVTLIFILEAMRRFTPLSALLLLIFFAGIEAYATKIQNSKFKSQNDNAKFQTEQTS